MRIITLSRILENLYPQTALAQDIAGTQESIANISVVDLKENHDVFYSPQEMTLLVVGNFDKEDIFKQIQESQKEKIRQLIILSDKNWITNLLCRRHLFKWK
nr:insulinase family protein [Streptococcus lutetiensis]